MEGFPRTHAELDRLAEANDVVFPDEAKVEEKQRLLADAGVSPERVAVSFRLVAIEELNSVEMGVGGELVRLETGQKLVTSDPHVILALDAHELVERTED